MATKTKKKSSKKTSVKKGITKMITKTTPAKAKINIKSLKTEGDKAFFMADGNVVYSIKDLPKMIERSDDNTFYHHVNSDRNDFANWINDVFSVSDLANTISGLTTKKDIVKALKSSLK